jgi:hypothetical protein
MAGEFPFLGPVDFQRNEARGFVTQVLTTAPTPATGGQLYTNSSGGVGNYSLQFHNGTAFVALGTGTGSGTVTSVSVATANGFAGTVANAASTPAITLTTTITGLLRGNGTAIAAAVAGTDYLTPTGVGSGLTALNATNVTAGTLALARGGSGADLSGTGGSKQVVQQAGAGAALSVGALDSTFISNFDTQVRTSRLDQMAAPTAAVTLNGQRLTNLADPTGAQDAATKAYADAIATGLDVKASVRAASTGNVAGTYAATGGAAARGQLTAMPNALDGVTLAAGNRILLKDQTVGAQDGIWVVTTLGTGANGVWDRAPDFDADVEVTAGAFVFVEEGAVNADSGWVLTTNNPITIGGTTGTALAFAQFSGAGQITAGAGLTKTGNTLDVGTASAGRIVVNADSIDLATVVTGGTNTRITYDAYGRVTAGAALATGDLPAGTARSYSATIGDGTTATLTVTHGLGTQDVDVTLRQAATPFGVGAVYWEATDVNSVRLYFSAAPAANSWRVKVTT